MKYKGLFILLYVVCVALATSIVFAEEESLIKPRPAEITITRHQDTEGLPFPVKDLLNRYQIPQKNISVFVRDIHADAPMVSHEADRPRNPASTMKLVTTFAALNILGPTWQWNTETYIRGELKDGVLHGDLILKGYGDPFLVHEKFWQLVRALRDKGLHTIQGDVIVDNSYFSLPPMNPGAFDNKPHRVYNAPPSALMYNFQATRFHFVPQIDKSQVQVTPEPWISGMTLNNQLGLSRGSCQRGHYRPKLTVSEQNTISLKGSYAAACGKHILLRVVSEAKQHVFNAFRDFWQELDGKLTGQLREGIVTAEDKLYSTHSSDTLSDQIRLINKWSNNVMTRQLLLTAGAYKKGAPGTLEKGREAIHELLNEKHIHTTDMFIDNGSGLSRDVRVTARQLGEILLSAYRDPFMPEFMASLSLSGLDGTLAGRFRREDLAGRSHLKTGTLNGVTAIAGYVLNRQGKRLVVVCLHNGSKTGGGKGHEIQNALLRWVFEQ